MLTEKVIKKMHKDLKAEIEELQGLKEYYKKQSEWNRMLHEMHIKLYLLEEILGID